MRIVLYEIKKIWNIKMILIVAVLCALFYMIFMGSYIKDFPGGHSIIEEIDYSIQMTQQYGPTLEADEYSEFITNTRKELTSEAENYIENMPIFAETGIYTYEDFEKNYEKSNRTALENDAIWTLFGEEANFVRFKLQAINFIEERFYNYPKYEMNRLASEAKSEKSLARLKEIAEAEEYRNIMDGWVFNNTVKYMLNLSILAVLAVLVFISPLIVTDRTRNIHLLHYTAKLGRTILKQQLIAIILSAFLLTTALIVAFGAIYSTNGTWPFWNSGLTSFLNLQAVAFQIDLTYGQYISINIGLLYIMCLSTAAIAFIISRFSQNLITLILKLIPAFALIGAVCTIVFTLTFSFENILYLRSGILGIEPIVCVLALLAGIAASVYTMWRERRVDVI